MGIKVSNSVIESSLSKKSKQLYLMHFSVYNRPQIKITFSTGGAKIHRNFAKDKFTGDIAIINTK